MALFKKQKDGYEKISWQKKYADHDVILCGTGPSLWEIDPEVAKASGVLLFGLNNSFERLNLDFWMAWDEPEQFDNKIWKQDIIKFYNRIHSSHPALNKARNMFFYKVHGVENKFEFGIPPVMEGPHIDFIFEGYTFAMALHMLHWLGFARVFLAGCDFGGKSALSRLSTGYKEEEQQKVLKKGLEFLEKASRERCLKFISCTPNSPINEFLPYHHISDICTLKV